MPFLGTFVKNRGHVRNLNFLCTFKFCFCFLVFDQKTSEIGFFRFFDFKKKNIKSLFRTFFDQKSKKRKQNVNVH